MDERDPVIGIDLGTTNSVVATVRDGQPVVIKNRMGQNLTPSVVAVTQAGKRLVGQIAKRQAITNPQETVYAAKRLIGRKFSSPQVQEAMKLLTYQVVRGPHDDVRVKLGGRECSLPELSGMVLRELRLDAEAYFGHPVTRAVITVPAYFSDAQRQATKDAGKIAGLEVLRILNEPTAAALAYGFGKKVRGKLAVFDLGGGTLDVSVLEAGEGVFEVVATGGDTFLGGEDFDNRIIGWLAGDFERAHKVDLRKDRMSLQRLRDAAEKAKIELSTTREVPLQLPFIHSPATGGTALHLEASLTREHLESLTAELCERAGSIAARVLEQAKLRPEQIQDVLLVGGMSRMPLVVDTVRRLFKREPSKGVHPGEVVALGAALHGHALVGGARRESPEVLLLDVTPQSLGMAVAGGYVRRLIPRNTTVPTSTTQVFATSRDNQTAVKILVLQGESDIAYENELLGEFTLTGLRQAPRGQVEIEILFEISAEGLVSVSARDLGTGQRQAVILTASSGLTREELQRIIDEQEELLLDPRAAEELQARRVELGEIIEEVRGLMLLPRLAALRNTGGEGAALLARSERHLVQAMGAQKSNDLKVLTQAHEELSATWQLLRGTLQRIGGAR